MRENISISNVMNSIIPISRFNKGEAGKIFDEVYKSGVKIVVKNNEPTCVLMTPRRYEELMETIEDYYLLEVAEKRMEYGNKTDFVSHDKVMKELNIQKEELEDVEVEIE